MTRKSARAVRVSDHGMQLERRTHGASIGPSRRSVADLRAVGGRRQDRAARRAVVQRAVRPSARRAKWRRDRTRGRLSARSSGRSQRSNIARLARRAGDRAPRDAGAVPDGRRRRSPAPLIPLLDTTLLTNAPGEPRVGSQIAHRDRFGRSHRHRHGVHPPKRHRAAARGAAPALRRPAGAARADDDLHRLDRGARPRRAARARAPTSGSRTT